MRPETLDAWVELLEILPAAVCKCTVAERDSGHRIDCHQEDVEQKCEALREEIAKEEAYEDD